MPTGTKELHRGYEIEVTNLGWTFQAAIHPTDPPLPKVDWEGKPINTGNIQTALIEARNRINAALSGVSA